VDPQGVLTAFVLAEAASEERPIGDALLEPPTATKSTWLTKGSQEELSWERHWLEDYEALVAATPKNNSRRACSKAERRWASGKRQIIEGVISQLKDFYGLEDHRAKKLDGLLRRLAAKIAAYTVCQRINNSLGRPLRHLADLLV